MEGKSKSWGKIEHSKPLQKLSITSAHLQYLTCQFWSFTSPLILTLCTSTVILGSKEGRYRQETRVCVFTSCYSQEQLHPEVTTVHLQPAKNLRILSLNFSEIAGAFWRFRAKWVKIRSCSVPKT